MKQEYTMPINVVQKLTPTGQVLTGLPNSNFKEVVAATPLLNENKFFMPKNEYQYIIKSELLPPLASGIEANKENGGDRMDESTKMLIERLERDSREREERYHQDAQEREHRYREESKERGERLFSTIQEIKTEIKDMRNDFKTELSSFENRVETKLTHMETKIDSTYKHISAITITTIIGISACVAAVVGVLIAAFTLLPKG